MTDLAKILAVGSRCQRHPAARGEARQDVAVASLSGLGDGGPDDNDAQANRVIAFAGHGEGEAQIANALKVPLGAEESGSVTVSQGASVRRLTPMECERLQGLPDGWTYLGGTADSKRYAAVGDAVTVPIAEWIGRRLHDSLLGSP